MKKCKKISFIALIVFTALQVGIYEENFLSKGSADEDKKVITEKQPKLAFNELYSRLSAIEGVEINTIDDEVECWQVSVTISGNKNQIKDVIESLAQYKINEYTITGEKNSLFLTIKMSI